MLIEQRQKKAEQLREMGCNPYSNDFNPRHTIVSIVGHFSGAVKPEQGKEPKPLSDLRFSIAGRIVEHRSFGKATFVKLADHTGRLQAYVRKDKVGEQAYSIFKKCENWDFIGVSGFMFFTHAGELTLMAEEVTVLTKTVRPPPEKWNGLKDQETRYRQRYVDLVANPEIAKVFRKRSKIIRLIRGYFDNNDFLEVETPILHSVRGGATAKPFGTHHNALGMPLYLRIAPELFLKRLVVGGLERVYEIGRNFRNEGLSRFHNPEFTMLEFYKAYATYEDMMRLIEEMICWILQKLDYVDYGKTAINFKYQDSAIDIKRPWPCITVKEAVCNAGCKFQYPIEPYDLEDEIRLDSWIGRNGLLNNKDFGEKLSIAGSCGEKISVLFDHLGEAELPTDRPTFVVDYPAETSPLARRKDSDPSIVERFELFMCGSEIANGFSELNDPADQRARFAKQLESKDAEAMEYDEDYCRALEYGMPPTAGAGIGIDRLVMLLCDQPSIRDVLLFPHMRPES